MHVKAKLIWSYDSYTQQDKVKSEIASPIYHSHFKIFSPNWGGGGCELLDKDFFKIAYKRLDQNNLNS